MNIKAAEAAEAMVRNIGGEENILSVRECVSRIRFTLKNASLTKEENLKRINGLKGIIEADSYYYLVPEDGQVSKIFNEIIKQNPGIKKEAPGMEPESPAERGLLLKLKDFFKGKE